MMMTEVNIAAEPNAYVDNTVYDLRRAAMTRRCHTVPTVMTQTVGEHSYHVAMLVLELTAGKASGNLMKAALFHDLAETSTGDVPANTKWRSPLLKQKLEVMEDIFNRRHGLTVELTPNEELILKWADSLELGFYCVDELNFGNKHVKDMYRNIIGFLQTLAAPENYYFTTAAALERLERHYADATN